MVKSAHLLLLLFFCCIYGNVSSTFTDRMIRATEFITKAKQNLSTDDDYINMCPKDCIKCLKDCPECPRQKPFDCADVLNAGHIKSGVYEIWLMNRLIKVNPLRVYCDMDTDGGGWTVIQRRGDFGSPKDFFFRDRKSYKEGFGEVEKDFWLGNEKIFALTNQKRYSVRFDLMDVEKNTRYAHYDQFWIIDPLMGYYLRIYNYSGNAGDAMEYHNNQIFTTRGARTSIYNCAAERKGGWWYTNQFIVRRWGCNLSNLNGIYHKGKYDGNATNFDGVTWVPWKGPNESLFWTEIKVRPKDFKAPLNV